MRMTAAAVAERRPQSSRPDHPAVRAGRLRRGELAAGLAAVAVAAQLALAPAALLIAALLVVVGRLSRWHLAWLLLPALASVGWLAAAGPPATLHALASGAGRLLAAEAAVAVRPERMLHPAATFAGSGRPLPGELPLLALAGTADAAVALWQGRYRRRRPGGRVALSRLSALWPAAPDLRPATGWRPAPDRRSAPDWRPGLVAAVRRRAAAAALAAGRTVTADGCAIGLDSRSGRRAAITWTQAAAGVVLTGGDPAGLSEIGLAIACAALRRRKTVIVLDLAAAPAPGPAGGASVAARVARHARHLGVPVTEIDCTGSVSAGSVSGSVSDAVGRAIRSRSALIVPAHRPEAAQRAAAALAGALASLRDLGLQGDCLAWVSSCERADASLLAGLLALGQATGTAVLLSVSSPEIAADLAAAAGLVVASGPITGSLSERFAATAPESLDEIWSAKCAITDLLRTQPRGLATLIADSGPYSFRIVPVAPPPRDHANSVSPAMQASSRP